MGQHKPNYRCQLLVFRSCHDNIQMSMVSQVVKNIGLLTLNSLEGHIEGLFTLRSSLNTFPDTQNVVFFT